MRDKRTQIGLLVLGWMLTVTTAYYIVHKPFDAAQALAVGQTVWAAAIAAWMIVIASGLGRGAARWLKMPLTKLSALERSALESGLGLGLGALAILLFGLASLWQPIVAWAVTLGATALLWRRSREWLTDLKRGLRAVRPAGLAEWSLAAFVGLTLAIALATALGPVASWDALLYHLTGPKWDAALGRVSVPPVLPPLGYSTNGEMLFTWALMLGGESAAAPVHWWFGLLLCLWVWQWARRWATETTGWLAVAILLSATSLPTLLGWPYIDGMLMFYSAAGFAALTAWREDGARERSWLLGAGILAGLGFGVKLTGAVAGLGLALLIAWWAGGSVKRRLGAMAVFGAAAVVVSLPILAKNAILTGNATYPFFWGGVGWDAWRTFWFNRPGTGWAYTDPILLLIAPWQMTVFGSEGSEWHATLGPLFLFLIPLLAVGWSARSRELRQWLAGSALLAAVLYAAWLYGAAESRLAQQPRLLFPVLPFLAVSAALAFDGLSALTTKLLSVRRVVGALVALVLALTAFQGVSDFAARGPGRVILGIQTRDEYLFERLGWYYGAIRRINELAAGSKVLFLFEPRAYHCAVGRCAPDGILDNWYHARRLGGTAQSIADDWRRAGMTHVLIYTLGAEVIEQAAADPFTTADWAALRQMQTSLPLVETFGEAYKLYRLPSN